jgi:tRNA (guanosine-2'-O-)-methyltransferase
LPLLRVEPQLVEVAPSETSSVAQPAGDMLWTWQITSAHGPRRGRHALAQARLAHAKRLAQPQKQHRSIPRSVDLLDPQLVIRYLAPHLTEGRKARIDEVLRHRLFHTTVVLENLYDPHNGAAVLRSCEALGLLHVHVVEGDEPFFFSRKVSRSAHKWLNVYLHPSAESCLRYLQRAGFACWAAVPPQRHAAEQSGPPLGTGSPLALVFGNEHAGLSASALSFCPHRFAIPMHGFTESLNLSVSVAISLYAVVHQAGPATRTPLPQPLADRLRAAYYAQSTAHAVEILLCHLRAPQPAE